MRGLRRHTSRFWAIASLGLKKWRKHKLETGIEIAGLTETGKIWHPEWSLSTKLDVELEDVRWRSALGDIQEFSIEVVPNGKREWLDFKTDSAKDFWVEKLEF